MIGKEALIWNYYPRPLGGEGCYFDFYPSPLGRACPGLSGRVGGVTQERIEQSLYSETSCVDLRKRAI